MNDSSIFNDFDRKEIWPYWKINREERNLVAILYHLLLSSKENLRKFLGIFELSDWYQGSDEIGIYFEYAFLRDAWAQYTSKKEDDRENNNNKKAAFINKYFKNTQIPPLNNYTNQEEIKKFNEYFGTKSSSSKHIESPSNWIWRRSEIYRNNLTGEDKELFFKMCMLTWSFNIKPDLVLIWEGEEKPKGLCIEAKLESGEDKYPSQKEGKESFGGILKGYKGDLGFKYLNQKTRSDSKRYVTQTKLQEFMFEEVLGFKNMKYFLIQKKDNTEKAITWKEIFEKLPIPEEPKFIRNFIKKRIEETRQREN